MKEKLRKSIYSTIHNNMVFKAFNKVIMSLYKYSLGLMSVNEYKVVFDNFGGKGFSDNPKYIAKELRKRNKNVKIIWLVNDKSKYIFPKYIKIVKINSFRGMFERATAKIWVDNIRHLHPIKKKKNQIYLQTWHAPFSPKKLERDAEDKLNPAYCIEAKYDGSITDGIIVNSELMEKQFRRSFWLNNDVEYLRIGLPRYDFLINNLNNIRYILSIRKKHKIPENAYVVLWAPTFRDDKSIEGYKIDLEKVICAFKERIKKEIIIIVRFHPNEQAYSKSICYSFNVRNGSQISDIQEISIMSDCVISDYSTSIFDFVIMQKPVYICALDLKWYESIRGLLPEFYEFPFPMALSNKELIKNILEFDELDYVKNIKEYFCLHPIYDKGKASKLAVDWILKKMKLN